MLRPPQWAFERLEPDAVKVARPVLRGGGDSNVTSLPDLGSPSVLGEHPLNFLRVARLREC